MKRRYMVIILIVVFGVLFWAITRDYANSVPTPAPETTPDIAQLPDAAPAQKEGIIVVSSPLPESVVSASPVVIKGRARGNWFFEASAPVSIVNWDGLIIGEGYISVDEGYDWMTTDMVPFTGTLSYDASQIDVYKHGWIILQKDNPSGEPQFDDSIEFKIFFP